MKLRILLFGLVLLSLSSTTGFSRNFSKLKSIELIERKDYARAESKVLDCCKYILKTPLDEKNKNRNEAIRFLFRWMEGTPDYTFQIDENAAILNQANQALIGVYMAGMTKYVLENRGKSISIEKIKHSTIKTVIGYCQNPGNKVEMNAVLNKWIQENNEDGPMKAI